MYSVIDEFKAKLKRGEAVVGPFVKTYDPGFIEVIGFAGMDYAIIDMEHGPVSVETAQNLIRGANVANILPVVRTPDFSEASIGKALDVGAMAVQIPQIQSAADASTALARSKFYPKGMRGVCRFVRAAKYSTLDKQEYFKQANETMVILQLEGKQAVDELDAILDVSGIDIIFIGPYDLSQSLGVPGEITSDVVVNTMQEIVEKARKKGIVVGCFVDEIEHISFWKKSNVQYISYSTDFGIFADACKKIKSFV